MMRLRTLFAAAALAAFALAAATAAHANWTASGIFRYRDRIQDLSGFTGATQDLPIRNARVEIVRSPSTVLATGATDANGAFSIPVVDNMNATVFARVISIDNIAGLNIRVQSTTSGTSLYAVASNSVVGHDPNTNTDFGVIVAVEGAGGEAFNIYDVIHDGSDYAATLLGAYPAQACTTVWSSSSVTGTYFSGSTIRLLSSEGWDDGVIGHEHGHFIDLIYSDSDSPGGPHFLGDNNQDIRLSYGEGLASYHMGAGRKVNGRPDPTFYIDSTGGLGPGNLNFSYEFEGPNISAIGAASEVSVTAALWDVIDEAPEDDLYPGDDDGLAVSHLEVWEVMDLYIPTATNKSLEDFWDGWFSPGIANGFQAAMEAAFGALTIEFFPDVHEPDGTAGSSSTISIDGTPQHHTFYGAGDVDVVRFLSPAGGTQFVVETVNLFSDANTNLEILDQSGTTVLANNDNRGAFDESSLLLWTAPAAGTYYARLNHSPDLGVYGSYDLRVLAGTTSTVAFTDVANTQGVASTRPGRGASWGDFDGDGDADLYVTNASGNAYHLYRNNGNGTFTDVAGAAGVTGGGGTGEQAVWGDYDNDGDLDLYVAVIGTNLLYRNNGNSTFTNVAAAAGVATSGAGSLGASWADYDGDGWLDLFVGTIDDNDRLYRNNGNGTFTDQAASAGVGGAGEDTFGGAFGDYDGDGDADLFVHYDGDANRLFANDGDGTFTEVTTPEMQEPGVRSWGASWTDYDHDGDLDLYVTTLGSPCRLFRNVGGVFYERGAAAGVNTAGSQTSHVAADFDNDLDDDIYVGAFDEPNLFYDNMTGAAFFNSGKIADNLQARSITTTDLEGDGDIDLYVVLSNGNNLLYRNDSPAGNWIRLRLQGVQSNRAAIGATVTLKSGGHRYVQQVTGGTGYLSQNDLRLSFLLNTLAGPDTFDIRWPSGAFQRVVGLARNQTHTILEQDQSAVPIGGAPPVTALALSPASPNPFDRATAVRFALPAAGRVQLQVLDVQGRLVRTLLDERLDAGTWEETWDGRTDGGGAVGPGVYFTRLVTPEGVRTRKVVRVE
jgi:hypothetical protein